MGENKPIIDIEEWIRERQLQIANQKLRKSSQAPSAPVVIATAPEGESAVGGSQHDPEPADQCKFDETYVLLIDAIDTLKLDSDFDLPEIVVLGNQSEGKSTVLEALAGVKLPRGIGTCTKCLISLCIRSKLAASDSDAPSITISLDGKNYPVEYPDDLSTQLRNLMEVAVPSGISMDKVISVKICGDNRPNLTVIDVPGFTSETDIKLIKDIEGRIKNPNVIMVVVLKAVNDSETSKGYELAKKLDPNWLRTVIVLTHCDNLQQNKQGMVSQMLTTLQPQTFAVNCYSAPDKEWSRQVEKDHLSGEFWNTLPSSRLGIASLEARLKQIIYYKVKPKKKEIESTVKTRFLAENFELQRLEAENKKINEEIEKRRQDIVLEISNSITGSHGTENKFYSLCRSRWAAFITELHKRTDEFTEQEALKTLIEKEYKHQPGRELNSLVSLNPVLERIVRKFMDGLAPNVHCLIDDIDITAQDHMKQVVESNLKDYAPLKKIICDAIEADSLTVRSEVTERILSVLDMEKVVFRTEAGEQSYQETTGKNYEQRDREVLLKECKNYLQFVKDRVANTIPKAFAHFMFRRLKDKIWDYVMQPITEKTRGELTSVMDSKLEKMKKFVDELNTLKARFNSLAEIR